MTYKEKLKAEIVNIRNDKKSILKFRQYPFFILTLMKVCDYLLSFIDSMQEEPVSKDLKEAANDYAVTVYNNYLDNPKAFENIDADTLNEDAFKAGAKWQRQQIKKSMDLGEPPYLISVEQAYYKTLKLLED